jgi:hypothetical protein
VGVGLAVFVAGIALFAFVDLAVATESALLAVHGAAGAGGAVLVAQVALFALLELAVAALADGDGLAVDAAPAVGGAVQLGAEVALFVGSLDFAVWVLVWDSRKDKPSGSRMDEETYPSPQTPPQTPSLHSVLKWPGLAAAPPTRRARKRLR